MNYKIIKKNDDIDKATIEKSDFTHTFTLGEVKDHFKQLGELKDRLEAQIKIKQVTKKFAEDSYPELKEYKEKDIEKLYAYFSAVKDIIDSKSTIKELNSQITQYEAEMKEIETQCHLETSTK